MKVLLPTNTTHIINIIPRTDLTGVISAVIIKEGVISDNINVNVMYTENNGNYTINFDLTGQEQDRFTIQLLNEDNDTVYRGKLFFTEQNTQDFKLTKNTYIYAG